MICKFVMLLLSYELPAQIETAQRIAECAKPPGFLVHGMSSHLPQPLRDKTDKYIKQARAEGIKNTGRWGREEERRATQILLSRWLINPANRPKLTEVLKEQGRRERHWHALHPITYVPDLPQNIPTRAVDPEENK